MLYSHIVFNLRIYLKLSHSACQKSIATGSLAPSNETTSACRAQIIVAITQGSNGNYVYSADSQLCGEAAQQQNAAVSGTKIPRRRVQLAEQI